MRKIQMQAKMKKNWSSMEKDKRNPK
jgi:hypothetical protein